jgi:hypothetical protein
MELRPVVGYEGYYEISDTGYLFSCERSMEYSQASCIVRRIKPSKQLAERKSRNGYIRNALHKDGTSENKYRHILVMESFIGSKPSGCEVNHKDGDKANNSLANLEYLTHRENLLHRYLPKDLTIAEYYSGCLSLAKTNTLAEVARKLNISKSSIRYTLNLLDFDWSSRLLPERPKKQPKIKKGKVSLRRVERPSKEDLYLLLLNNNFSIVGRMFGVSCNAIRKWCISYGIPSKSSVYKKLT